jgi:hypothetical protein
MSLLILTEENCLALKRAVSVLLPEVRSAHLTESIAAALGFNTHAALRTAIIAESHIPPELAEVDMARFESRISELDYCPVAPVNFSEIVRSSAIPDRPFVTFKKGDMAANNSHFHHCRRANRPMVYVARSRVYATLNWDCITINPADEKYLFGGDNGSTFSKSLFSQFQLRAKGAPGIPYYSGGSFAGDVKKLLPETAYQLAEDYFKLLYLPLRSSPSG